MIKQYNETYNFDKVNFTKDKSFSFSPDGFVIKIGLNEIPTNEGTLFEYEPCIKISHRVLTPADKENLTGFEKGECYYQVTDSMGCVPIIEVTLKFFDDYNPNHKFLKLGLNLLQYDITKDNLYIVYDKINFRLVYGGNVVNNDLPFGSLAVSNNSSVKIDGNKLCVAEYSNDIKNAVFFTEYKEIDKKPIFYTPIGHNTFIGDVVNFYHNGTYHMLYMPDRHHHGNRWGGGGHHFEHMITKDFISWEDVGPVWEINEPWHSTGTGTMFFHKGKYYVAYGMHTSRMIPNDLMCSEEMHTYFKEHEETRSMTFDEIKSLGKYPGGGSYAVSDDGIHFTPSNEIFTLCENPSVYSFGSSLKMYSGYNPYAEGRLSTFEASDMSAPWKCGDDLDVQCEEDAPMKNSTECPSFFEWNGYKYLIMGFTGFWRTEKNSDVFIDSAAEGYDIYEGLNVPMAVVTDDNRAIIAGWLGGLGWASAVSHRELVQYEDGTLGTKWLPELFPKISDFETNIDTDGSFLINEKGSYYIEAEINPNDNETNIKFIDTFGKACELKLCYKEKTAQYAACFENLTANLVPPMYIAVKTKTCEEIRQSKAIKFPHKGGDFSIAHVRYPKENFKVKILVHYLPKGECCIIDTEIAETRTLVTVRNSFVPIKIKTDDSVKNVKIYNAEI